MSYLDIGFNDSLEREDSVQSSQSKELGPSEVDQLAQQISGSTIQGGSILSPDGRVVLDLEQGSFKINDGVQDLIVLGALPDGSIGMLIRDGKGNTLQQISSSSNIIKSADDTFEIDLDNDRILFKDEQGNPIAVFGEVEDNI